MKKVLCTLLSVALCLTMVSFPVSAEESARYTISPEVAGTESAVVLTDEDLTINEEVAEYIAQFFVEDMMATGQTTWETEPTIVETVPMYDANGEEITAYTVELSSGYVVVSAYIDVPNIILEWADEAEPIYANYVLTAESKIVYTGNLNYLIDTGGELFTGSGTSLERDAINSNLEDQRALNNVEPSLLSFLIEQKSRIDKTGIVSYASNNTSGGYITDPLVHARNVYGGTWVAYQWSNKWESYANFATVYQFSGYEEHCGPVAITNMIKMYGDSYYYSSIMNESDADVFDTVIGVNSANDNKYYANRPLCLLGGTLIETAGEFIQKCFLEYGKSVLVSDLLSPTFSNITNDLTYSNRLIYMALNYYGPNNPYGNHAVVIYAYTQLRNSNVANYRTYVKICDGLNYSARYLQFESLADGHYYRVTF